MTVLSGYAQNFDAKSCFAKLNCWDKIEECTRLSYIQLFEVRCGCSFCWYWGNCGLSLFKLSCQKSNKITKMNSRDLENVMMHDKIAIFNTVYIVSSVNYFIYCNWWTMIKFVNDTWLYHQVTGSQIIS